MSNELKPCPFCGGKAAVEGSSAMGWYIICKGCGISAGMPGDELSVENAVARWNKRAVPPIIAEFIYLVSNDNGSSSHNSLIVRCLRRVREFFGVDEGYDGRMP